SDTAGAAPVHAVRTHSWRATPCPTTANPATRVCRGGNGMARRDITGAVDFGYLEDFAAGDEAVVEEVLELFRQQAALWSTMLDAGFEGWKDAVHTIKGAARGVGAFKLGEA